MSCAATISASPPPFPASSPLSARLALNSSSPLLKDAALWLKSANSIPPSSLSDSNTPEFPRSSSSPLADAITVDFPRSVLGVRCENHEIRSPVCFFKELHSPKVKTRGHNGLPHHSHGNENSDAISKVVRSPLKRKRPPKLDIPESENIATPCNLQEQINEINVGGPTYGVSCKKGRREILEDAYNAIPNFQGQPKQAFFGVFDGHSGCSAVDFVAENLAQEIGSAIDKGHDCIEEAVTAAFLATDAGFLRKDVDSGASCAAAIIRNGYLVVANAGDCRIVMSRNGKAEALTRDHKPDREDERQRIERLGGYVDCFNGVWRVQGVLAVSRGFGDRHLKEFISAKPEVKKLPLTPECEFLILASDGLWDKVGNQEAVDCARAVFEESQRLRTGEIGVASNALVETNKVQMPGSTSVNKEDNNTLSSNVKFVVACKKLVELAASRGSIDDISVVIAHLEQFR